jgi:hypothetical protein
LDSFLWAQLLEAQQHGEHALQLAIEVDLVAAKPPKGKVERPFRTVKEAHETLYHFHEPQNEAEANLWLRRYLINYNS